MKSVSRNLTLLTLCAATGTGAAGGAHASSMPLGIWTDEDGRAAIEVRQCGNALCGFIVWVRDKKDQHGCGKQIMGNVVHDGNGWDNGWIINPKDLKKYSVALEPLNANTVKVVGYSGIKLFSESTILTRVTHDIERCDRPAAPRVITASATPSKWRASVAQAPAKRQATKPAAKPAVASAIQVASAQATPSNDAVDTPARKTPVIATVAVKRVPIWTGPTNAPAPERKPEVILASYEAPAVVEEPVIVAPAPQLAQRPRIDMPPPMALGRGVDDVEQPQEVAQNDCGLREQFFALFGATCKKK